MRIPRLILRYDRNTPDNDFAVNGYVPNLSDGDIILPPPSLGLSRSVSFAIRQAEFGDGYTQRVVDGLNTRRSSWSVQWLNLSTEDTIKAANFLDERAGAGAFEFNPLNAGPDKIVGDDYWTKVHCNEYSLSPKNADLYDVSCTFTKVFDL